MTGVHSSAVDTAASLTCKKHLFSLPDGRHYLNCARMSPLSKRVEQAGIEGIRRKVVPDRIDTELFFAESLRLRELFASLIGAPDPLGVALHPSVSYGIATVARNLSPSPEQNLVVLHEQFPSNVYSWRRLADETGCELRSVAPPETSARRAEAWNERILEAVDSSTCAVALPVHHWSDGTRFDLPSIAERARAVGAALIVDGTQSLGAVPFDFARIRPDALVAAGYKTLHGPYSTGFAYYGERFLGGRPLEENWITRLGSEDFAGLVAYADDYQPGALRFDYGERSNFVLNAMSVAALEQILEWRPDRIERYCVELTSGLFDALREHGYRVEDDAWRGCHLFGVRPPAGTDARTIEEALRRANVSVSVRGTAVRISPSVYNDRQDIEALEKALTGVL